MGNKDIISSSASLEILEPFQAKRKATRHQVSLIMSFMLSHSTGGSPPNEKQKKGEGKAKKEDTFSFFRLGRKASMAMICPCIQFFSMVGFMLVCFIIGEDYQSFHFDRKCCTCPITSFFSITLFPCTRYG